MRSKISCQNLSEKCLCLLLIISMLSVKEIRIADFSLYSLMLLLITSVWTGIKRLNAVRAGETAPFLGIRYPTDTAAFFVIVCVIISIIVRLFRPAQDNGIDFSWSAEVIALAFLCLLLSSGVPFKLVYLDVILYCGLLCVGAFLLVKLTEGWENSALAVSFADSGVWASRFLLICMIAVYLYCECRDRMRSLFYLLAAGIGFLALFLNQNVISLWLMAVYFLAIPVVLCPTAVLLKRSMQLFFTYLFLLSNMGLIAEYTKIIQGQVYCTLEDSIYLDVLVAVGGAVFFHYWERIPEGMDLERLVLRKMQKGYRFLLKMILLLSGVILLSGERWTELPEGVANDVLKWFAVSLVGAVGDMESGFWHCFRSMGALPGIFAVVCVVLFLGRMGRNYQPDKSVTGSQILISGIFFIQLLFWNPGIHNIVVYGYLLMLAAYYKEERKQVRSVGFRLSG